MQILMILLTILKVIGIVLVSIVGFILLLILIVLFVPIRYEGEFEYDEELTLKAKVSWFLKLFSIKWEYINNEMHIKIRVIKLLKDKNKEKTDNNPVKEVRDKAPNKVDNKIVDDKTVDKDLDSDKDDDKVIPELVTEYRQADNIPSETKKEIKKTERQVKDKGFENQSTIEHKTKKKRNKTKYKKKTKTQEPSILDKIKAVYQHEDREAVFRSCKKSLIKLLKHIKPRKFNISLVVGFEDPSNTGYVLALDGVLKPFIDKNNHLQIQGEFNNEIFEGKGYFKGRIYLYYITLIAGKLLLDKKVRNYASFIMRTFRK
ncbi:DUF2953 domain-containing protein [Vallitalea okinawensis]|uniref:DUF2953 domain-containing protein n=1 Tax=Vallitalea okinawensis TaxID=2078660 RepID=UPI000CFAF3AE|nr:DUF2953 domain-containing protein [Vallitalea okinawensis]